MTREASWFHAVGVAGLPDVAGAGGQFDVVDAYPRRLAQAPRQCWLYRHGATDHPEARTRGRMLHHHFMAIVWWPRRLGAERAMTEQQAMANTIVIDPLATGTSLVNVTTFANGGGDISDPAGTAMRVNVNGASRLPGKVGAITTPTAPSAVYVQAEAAAMKTAVDALRAGLIAIGGSA